LIECIVFSKQPQRKPASNQASLKQVLQRCRKCLSGTRPHPTRWRSQYLDQGSDAFAKGIGQGFGWSLTALPSWNLTFASYKLGSKEGSEEQVAGPAHPKVLQALLIQSIPWPPFMSQIALRPNQYLPLQLSIQERINVAP
jgi:hypothetical protein